MAEIFDNEDVVISQDAVEAVDVKGVEETTETAETTEVLEAIEVAEVVETGEFEVPVEAQAVDQVPEVVQTMADFEKEINQSFKKIYDGDVVKGQVISVTSDALLVNIGYISDAIVPKSETFVALLDSLDAHYKEGDDIYGEVITRNDGEGNVLLSIKKAMSIIGWRELEAAYQAKTTIEVVVSEVVKGGLVCQFKGVRCFMPGSLVSARYVENLAEFMDQTLTVQVIEFNQEDNKAVVSRKALEVAQQADQKKNMMATIQKNDRLTGVVKKVMDFGAFVDLGGVDGLIHIRDLAWTKVKHPSEVVKEGDRVNVTVLEVDYKREKISLALKDVAEDPWQATVEKLVVGNVYMGTVTKIAEFGAFVQLENGIEGLVHISELSENRVTKVRDFIEVGASVRVKLVALDAETKKIKLSMKDAQESENAADVEKYKATEESATTNLENVFAKFLKDLK